MILYLLSISTLGIFAFFLSKNRKDVLVLRESVSNLENWVAANLNRLKILEEDVRERNNESP